MHQAVHAGDMLFREHSGQVFVTVLSVQNVSVPHDSFSHIISTNRKAESPSSRSNAANIVSKSRSREGRSRHHRIYMLLALH